MSIGLERVSLGGWSNGLGWGKQAYHWADVWMWNRVELGELELVIGPDVDIRPAVLSHVTVFRSRKHWEQSQSMLPPVWDSTDDTYR